MNEGAPNTNTRSEIPSFHIEEPLEDEIYSPDVSPPEAFEEASLLSHSGLGKIARVLGFSALVAVSPTESAVSAEQTLSLEKTRIIETVLGSDVVEKFRAKGFQFTVPVEADENGSYVIHVGQLHRSSSKEKNEKTDPKTLAFQEILYESLPAITDRVGSNVVFAEFVVDDRSAERDLIAQYNQRLVTVESTDIRTKTEVEEAIQVLGWYAKYYKDSLIQNSTSPELIKSTASKLKAHFETLTSLTAESRESLDKFIQSAEAIVLDPNDAGLRLYMEGSIDVQPAETKETNKAGTNVIPVLALAHKTYVAFLKKVMEEKYPKMHILYERFEKLRSQKGTLSPEEEREFSEVEDRANEYLRDLQKELKDAPESVEYDKAVALFQERAYVARNKVVLDKISEYEKQKAVSLPHAVVVFGAGHLFAQQLLDYNLVNAELEKDRGLIEIKMSDYNTLIK